MSPLLRAEEQSLSQNRTAAALVTDQWRRFSLSVRPEGWAFSTATGVGGGEPARVFWEGTLKKEPTYYGVIWKKASVLSS